LAFKLHQMSGPTLDWVRQEIAHFSGGLRQQLLAKDWSNVRLFAWLPADLPADLEEPLDASFVVRLGREHEMDWDYTAAETGYIQTHLAATYGGIFLYQADYFRLERDPVATAPGEQIVIFDRGLGVSQKPSHEVWVYLDSDFEDSEAVRLAYHRGIWPQHGLGILTSLPRGAPRLVSGAVADPRTMKQLSENTRTILVPGWRGNAFIFVEWNQG
jgi:hypothetical protein